MIRIDIDKIIYFLFIAMILFAGVPYLPDALDTLKSGGYVLWTYKDASGMSLFHVMKDILALILLVLLFFRLNKNMSTVIKVFAAVMIYGLLMLVINALFNQYSLWSLVLLSISSMRNYVFFIVIMMYGFKYIYENDCVNVYPSLNVFRFILLVQTIIAFMYAANSGSLAILGSGGYRIPAAFPNSGTLGCFCIGMAVFISVVYCKHKLISTAEAVVSFLMIMFCVFASGMRSAQIVVVWFVFVTFIYAIYNGTGISKRSIVPIAVIIGGCTLPVLVRYIVDRTGRGAFGDSAGGRISTYAYLFDQNVLRIIFGQGLGIGTNTAINLRISGSQVFDGTLSTTMGQFGILGIVVFVCLFLMLIKKMLLKSKGYDLIVLSIAVTLALIFITGNFFEQFIMVIWTVYASFLLTLDTNNIVRKKKKYKIILFRRYV